MAVAYRSSSTSGTTDAQGTSRTVPVPAGAAIGDIVIICLEMWQNSGDPAVTYPAGFTEIVNIALTGSGPQKLNAAWKRLSAADTGNYSMSWTGTQWNQAQAICISGALASGDPIDFVNTATSAAGTSVPSTSGTATDLDFLVHLVANENSCTKTAPTGHTEVQDANYLETNYKIVTATGTQDASGGTLSVNTLSLAALIAIKPASGGGSVSGTAVANLPGSSSAATGVRTVVASAAVTMAAVAAVAVGVPVHPGVASAALPAPTVTASGLRAGHGSGAAVLGNLAGSAVGSRATAATAAVVLPSVIGTAAASVSVTGTAAATLPGPGSTAAGLRQGHGSGDSTLPGVVAAATGSVSSGPVAVAVLPAPVAVMAGTRATAGTAAANLPAVVTLAVGVRQTFGTAVAGLPQVTGSGSQMGQSSAAASLPGPVATATGSRNVQGTASAVLPAAAATATQDLLPPIIDELGPWLTLGDLMDARATHESIMLDTIAARHPGMVEGPFDEELGYAPATPRANYYVGKATIQARQISAGVLTPAGLGTLIQLGYAVHGPVGSAFDQVAPGDIITVIDSADPLHAGKEIVVKNVESSSFVTARRVVCVDYQPSTP